METYKRKLENLGDLKRQMKLLEENNMTYMQNTVSLEEELRKANAARAQLETYKRQVNNMQNKSHTVHHLCQQCSRQTGCNDYTKWHFLGKMYLEPDYFYLF